MPDLRRASRPALVALACLWGCANPPAEASKAASAPARIDGFADLHVHQFANLGFGGLMLWGAPWDPSGDLAKAVPRCDFADVAAVTPLGLPVLPVPFLGTPVHGAFGLGDLIGLAVTGRVGHGVGGAPDFDGWPHWKTATHQQAHVDWLRRAHDGGLKLMVLHAVNNSVLCHLSNQRPGFGCADMDAVDRQLAAAHALEAWIDQQAGGPGLGWYRIVTSGRAARQAIERGQLAVVLGMEVDDLFGCNAGGCTEASVAAALDHYHALGVRTLYPVHVFDNAFGGAAVYHPLFDYANKLATGDWFHLRDCSAEGFQYRQAVDPALALLFGSLTPPASPPGAHCNARPLQPLGRALVSAMMDRGMIVDVDHLDALALDEALGMAEARRYPGVVMGHASYLDINLGPLRSEGAKPGRQLDRLRALGGVPAVILHQGSTAEIGTFPAGGAATSFVASRVPNDCGTSSRSLAQVYLHVAEAMRGGAVAFGSDLNGMALEPAPRFGPDACDGDRRADQGTPFTYPFTLAGRSFDRAAAGSRRFDFNVDGMAHIGMYPDLIHDLSASGVSDADLAPLFSSAEAYVAMWERLESVPPVARARDVEVEAGPDCTAAAAVDAGSYDPDGGPVTVTQSPPGPYAPGRTTVTLTVTDASGASASATATVTVVDRAGPTLTAVTATPGVLWPPNHALVDVTIGYGLADACAASAGAPPGAVLSVTAREGTVPVAPDRCREDVVVVDAHHVRLRAERAGRGPGRTYTVTVTATDASGNSTEGAIDVVVPHDRGHP
ncbi:MAG: membrane dipeptidase [Anaeromyxobacteraceae bacterium]